MVNGARLQTTRSKAALSGAVAMAGRSISALVSSCLPARSGDPAMASIVPCAMPASARACAAQPLATNSTPRSTRPCAKSTSPVVSYPQSKAFMGTLVLELARSREDHGDSLAVGGTDHLVVPNRAAGLDDRRDVGRDGAFDAVGKGKVRVRGEHRARGAVAGVADGEIHRVDALHLAGANADDGEVLGQHNGIALDVFDRLPGELEVGDLGEGRLALADDTQGYVLVAQRITVLR